jgi:hypothetical protein
MGAVATDAIDRLLEVERLRDHVARVKLCSGALGIGHG